MGEIKEYILFKKSKKNWFFAFEIIGCSQISIIFANLMINKCYRRIDLYINQTVEMERF